MFRCRRVPKLVALLANPPLRPHTQRVVQCEATYRSVFNTSDNPDLEEAAYMELEAARARLRAEVREARQVAGLPPVSEDRLRQVHALLGYGGAA